MKMLFPFVFIISFLFYTKVKHSTVSQNDELSAFFDREHQANSTRRKDISNLDYITLSLESLPFLENPSKKILSYENDVRKLAGKKILKLTGITNTELKLTYGASNLTALSEYDENYMQLCTVLTKWGKALLDENYTEEARQVLEFALSCGCDTSAIYVNLATIYRDTNPSQIQALIKEVKASSNPLRKSILAQLQSILNSAKG